MRISYRYRRVSLLILLTLISMMMFPTFVLTAQEGGMDPVSSPEPLPTRSPRPYPWHSVEQDGVTLEYFFQTLPQGEARLLHVFGQSASGSPIQQVKSLFLERESIFFPAQSEFWGLLSVDMEQYTHPAHPLVITVDFADGTQVVINSTVEVIVGSFIVQEVSLPADRTYLLDLDIERAELARVESLFQTQTLEMMWDETGWDWPIPSALTSPFGAFRVFNNSLNTRHTGWDIRASLGQPVFASASGVVVFTGPLDIRGNYVLIDHGYGIYSGYAHFLQTHVTRGQQVERGQVIGTVGDTGRTTGPHFHWEMAVNGTWVNSRQFLTLWLP